MDVSQFSFFNGVAPFQNLVFTATSMDKLVDDGHENPSFIVLDVERWERYEFSAL